MNTNLALIAAASLGRTSCLDVAIEIDTDLNTVHTLTVDLRGECDGSGEGDGTSFDKYVDGDDCVIDMQWAGDVLDLSDVRANVDDEAEDHDVDPASARIQGMEFTSLEAAIVDADGQQVDAFPFPDLDATLYFDDIEAMTVSQAVLGGTAWEIAAEASEDAVVVVDEAYRSVTPIVAGHVSATLRVPLSAFVDVQGAPGPAILEIESDIVVTAVVAKKLF